MGLGVGAAIAIGLGVVLGLIAIRDLAWSQTGKALLSAVPTWGVAALALFLTSGMLRGLRWHELLRPHAVSATRLFLIEQTGSALDTFSFIHILDEIVETGILVQRDQVPTGKVLATLAAQRTLEFSTLVIVLGGGALFLSPLSEYRSYLVGGMTASVAALVALFTIGPALARLPVLRRIGIVGEFSQSAADMRSDVRGTSFAFALSVAQSLAMGTAGWLLCLALHIHLGFLVGLVLTLAILFFGSTVPGLPMAIGTYEFAAVALFGLWNVPAADAVGYTVLLRALVYLPPLFTAAFFLPREGITSIQKIRALAQNR